MDEIHRVAVIVDENFCEEKLFSIASKMHVWLLESEGNLVKAKAFFEKYSSKSDDLLADGVTTFQSKEEGLSPADILDSVIDEVDEHHNEYSHTPGWSELHVYGAPLTDKIKTVLKEFGFLDFKSADLYSFIANK